MKESDLWDLLPPERPLPAHRRREVREALTARRSRPIRVAAAALVVAAVGGAVAIAGRAGPPTAPAEPAVTVEAALATSSSALAESGRVACAYDGEVEGEVAWSGVDVHRFAGDDRSVTWQTEGEPYDVENRIIAGEPYSYWAPDPAVDPTPRWYHWTDDFARGGTADEVADNFDTLFGTGAGLDPATLFDELAAAGPFDEVGDETVDGVATRRLRATHPETILGLCGGNAGFEPGGVTTLDIWIEDSGFVRRVDGTWRGSGAGASGDADATGSFSVTFSGYGEPATIEVPPDAVDASLVEVLAGR